MSEQIEPGEGWRFLGPDEVIRKGDEVYMRKDWFVTLDAGLVFADHTYRRRIPAKPEPIWIDGHLLSLNEGSVRIGSKAYEYCFPSSTEDIRQLADWLTRFANWREAQDAGK